MDERTRRIIESAIQLADKGGFQAVRLRDVAKKAGVALGTLYSRFRSKEDILVAALEEEAVKLEEFLRDNPPEPKDPIDRVNYFFTVASRALFSRPNFARAVLRSVASGEPATAEKVLSFQVRITSLVIAAMRGEPLGQEPQSESPEYEHQLAFLLQQLWFAALVGWMGGMHDEDGVIEYMVSVSRIVSEGLRAVEGTARKIPAAEGVAEQDRKSGVGGS